MDNKELDRIWWQGLLAFNVVLFTIYALDLYSLLR